MVEAGTHWQPDDNPGHILSKDRGQKSHQVPYDPVKIFIVGW
jgi:hypothetical protein